MPRTPSPSQSQSSICNPQSAISDRLRIRTGRLARTQREDHATALEAREPEELFEPFAIPVRDAEDPNP